MWEHTSGLRGRSGVGDSYRSGLERSDCGAFFVGATMILPTPDVGTLMKSTASGKHALVASSAANFSNCRVSGPFNVFLPSPWLSDHPQTAPVGAASELDKCKEVHAD
jgi:hypothetical protein